MDGYSQLVQQIDAIRKDFDRFRAMTVIPSGRPTMLYNGEADLDYGTAPGSGTTDTVTLSETAADFKKMTILFHDDQAPVWSSVEVPFPDGKSISMVVTSIGGSNTQPALLSAERALISGTSISPFGYFRFYYSSGFVYDNAHSISIARVEGWK